MFFPFMLFGTPGREKMRSFQGSCKILVKMQLLVRSCNEICLLNYPSEIIVINVFDIILKSRLR